MPGRGLAAAAMDAARETAGVGGGRLRAGARRRAAGQHRDSEKSEGLEIANHRRLLLRSGDGLVQVPDNIVDIFDAHGDPHQVLADSGRGLLLVVQLLVRGRSRVNDQALGVAEVGQVREDLHGVDQLAPGLRVRP